VQLACEPWRSSSPAFALASAYRRAFSPRARQVRHCAEEPDPFVVGSSPTGSRRSSRRGGRRRSRVGRRPSSTTRRAGAAGEAATNPSLARRARSVVDDRQLLATQCTGARRVDSEFPGRVQRVTPAVREACRRRRGSRPASSTRWIARRRRHSHGPRTQRCARGDRRGIVSTFSFAAIVASAATRCS
jgi:hypothetical protein